MAWKCYSNIFPNDISLNETGDKLAKKSDKVTPEDPLWKVSYKGQISTACAALAFRISSKEESSLEMSAT